MHAPKESAVKRCPRQFNLFAVTVLAHLIFGAAVVQGQWLSPDKALDGLNAQEAIAYANEWKWSHPDITSYVNSRELVFKFPDNTVSKIPLPQDKMYIAIAPYIRQTHR